MGSTRILARLALLVPAIVACSSGAAPTSTAEATSPLPSIAPLVSALRSVSPTVEVTPMPTSSPFTLSSTAFAAGAPIPREYTCDGANISPALSWTGAPAGTAALVLVVDDPDARGFVHWLVLDLPAADGGLPRGVAPGADPPQQGRNDFGHVGWGGPCPPSGTHHYRFTLTALAAPLGLADHPGGTAVKSALAKANVLGSVTLGGTYRRG